MARPTRLPDDLIEVRHAAVLVSRHPETIRRWVSSGRLAAQRRGRRLLVARSEVQSVAGQDGVAATLDEWADRASVVRSSRRASSWSSAADLVIEDRRARAGITRSRARR